jgi:N-methylhydantoinase A
MDVREAAWGILTVLATNCMSAMRTITVERGYDPREFTLVPFGGMGPTIAWRVAAELGIGRILVPRYPGAFSAWGMLVTDVHQEHSATRITPLDQTTPEAIEALFGELEAQGIEDLLREKLPRESIRTLRAAGMRYRGQSYEVSVPVGALTHAGDLDKLAQVFHEAHRRRYGHMAVNEGVEIVNFKVTAVGEIAKPRLEPATIHAGVAPNRVERRQAHFGQTLIETPIFRRNDLVPGAVLEGPAIIEEQTSTTVLAPGQRATVDEYLNIEIDFGAAG